MKAQSIRKMQDLLKDPNIKDKADIARRLAGYLDAIVRENSAFGSFEDLVKARGGYVPSIEVIEAKESTVEAQILFRSEPRVEKATVGEHPDPVTP